jgi:hypothetical protein
MAIPEIVLYEHAHFGGRSFRTNLHISSIRRSTMEAIPVGVTPPPGQQLYYVSWDMNDKVSSFIVISGKWQFFLDDDFQKPAGPPCGPGYYPYVEYLKIPNDHISSFKCIQWTED